MAPFRGLPHTIGSAGGLDCRIIAMKKTRTQIDNYPSNDPPSRLRLLFETKALLWFFVIIVVLPLPAVIEYCMAKLIWEKDLSNVKVSFNLLEYVGTTKLKPTADKPVEIALDKIKSEIENELRAGRGPSGLKDVYKSGNCLDAKYTVSSVNPAIKVFLLLFPPIILAWSFSKFKESWLLLRIKLSPYPEIESLVQEHGNWFKKHGLAKIQVENPDRRTDYYKTLELISEGYKALCGTKDQPDNIYLFLKGSLENIHHLATEDPNSVELDSLYRLINKLACVNNQDTAPKYNVTRGLICLKQEYDQAEEDYGDWHTDNYPKIKNKWIDFSNPNVRRFVQQVGDINCDFAIFENIHQANLLCVGFYAERVTFVLLDRLDDLGKRKDLFIFSKEHYLS
jgi:hypothetical protein